MDAPRRTPRIGNESTRTGLASRMSRARSDDPGRDELVTSRGADELLARAREAGTDDEGPDESTLADIQSLLRDV
ncbi:MAG TPA: hypothetical protein VFN21_08035 [Acidimicrobiales bacterium]|nr:hypothetical protein [Acidimicrobiales bacterium]